MLVSIVALICFTGLAFVFDHWGIALFSLLFLFSQEKKDVVTIGIDPGHGDLQDYDEGVHDDEH